MKLNIPFVLASRSPRRRRLLDQIGLDFDVDVSDVDESVVMHAAPSLLTETLARRKAEDVARRRPDALTLGADTVVVFHGQIMGKPADTSEAIEMLRQLSGNTHVVYTGIALLHPWSDRAHTASEATRVTFGEMDDDEISAYVATGSPMDKAGGYGIQDDRGALFVERIDGDYYNVVGLPLRRFYCTMRESFSDLLDQ